jgi:hypothetical protein
VWFWGLLEPCFSGAFLSVWIDARKRRTKSALRTLLRVYQLAFEEFPVILGVTKQQTLLHEHGQLGYTCLGQFPKFWAGEDAWVVGMTKEDFEKGIKRRFERLVKVR